MAIVGRLVLPSVVIEIENPHLDLSMIDNSLNLECTPPSLTDRRQSIAMTSSVTTETKSERIEVTNAALDF